MKKVGIASCYFKYNYGSVLQAYATQRAVDRLGIPNETIDISGCNKEIRRGKMRHYWNNALNFSMYNEKKGFVRQIVKRKLDPGGLGKDIATRRAAFDRFCRTHFRMSPAYPGMGALHEACKGYSHVLVGSDQLWLPLNIEGDYYTLNFVPDPIVRIAYATSFGVASLPKRLHAKTAAFLERIPHLSVRESSGQGIVRQLTGRDVPVVCDPTLLFTGPEWEEIQRPRQKDAQPYILCYFLSDNPQYRSFAMDVKKQTGYRIIALRHLDEYIPGDDSFGDDAPFDIDPAQFVSLIRDAAYICTDSFHGTVFSILNHKEFFTFRRYRSDSGGSTNSRYASLFAAAGIRGRLFTGNEPAAQCLAQTIDYSEIDRNLEHLRGLSMEFLRGALSAAEADILQMKG